MIARPNNNHSGAEAVIYTHLQALSAIGCLVQLEVSRDSSEFIIHIDGHLYIPRINIHNTESVRLRVVKRVLHGDRKAVFT